MFTTEEYIHLHSSPYYKTVHSANPWSLEIYTIVNKMLHQNVQLSLVIGWIGTGLTVEWDHVEHYMGPLTVVS